MYVALELPTILLHSEVVKFMDLASFTCEISGTPSISVNWSYPISDERVNIRSDINHDQIISTLTIESVLFSDAGEYVCTASTQGLTGRVQYDLTIGMYSIVNSHYNFFVVLLSM